ncbi:MAG: MotA/TolQ/ExbB proton channel family protein [Rubripirellula sp.]
MSTSKPMTKTQASKTLDAAESLRETALEDRRQVTNPPSSTDPPSGTDPQSKTGGWMWQVAPIALGAFVTIVFYGIVNVADWAPLNRYFLGHPVAIAATTLFCMAASILAVKASQVADEHRRLGLLREEDLRPSRTPTDSPALAWQHEHDAGLRARVWREDLAELPSATRGSQLVRRLDEILVRQSHRSSVGELPEDMRELSMRDADEAHDSLGLIRIIVWAIPMLGFLGTVIGITQTLGGLDFTDGTAAVDRLKSGLYVAFDTTALGLVLSVIAIFLQFPVERSNQNLLSEVDLRVRRLVSSVLGGEDPKDNQTALVTQLCAGIQAAVAESLATQAQLWRQTIEEAQQAWRTQHTEGAEQFRQTMRAAMEPALIEHADRIDATMDQIRAASKSVQGSLAGQTELWQKALEQTAVEVQTHRRTLLTHTEAMTTLAAKQASEDQVIRESLRQIDGQGSSEAMKTLAKAVEVLATRLPNESPRHQATRRAA